MSDQANEINDVAPSSLKHIVGQASVIAQVAVALEAAWADSKKMDDCLLVGGPGLGKTQVAKVIAAELAVECHEILSQSIKNAADLNAVLLAAKEKDVVFLDEVHELPKEQQTALYLALDQRKIVLAGGRSGRAPTSIPIANFTLLLCSTEEFCILQPLRERMKLVLRFQFYTVDELTTLVKQRSQGLRWKVNDAVFPLISQRSKGVPRLGLRILQSARRVCRSEGNSTITEEHLERACQLEGIDALGLGPTEQQYLQILAEGPTRLNVLASMLGLPTRTVSQVTEPFLLRAELICKDDQGKRQLTALGHEHLANSQKNVG
jgi:holliday junction DNA helicase RuvB